MFMKKVAIIGNVASMMITFRGDLIKKLSASGVCVYCFCVDYDQASMQKVIALGGFPVEYELDSKGLNPIADLKSIFFLQRKLKDLRVDVVFAYFVKPVLFGGLAAKMAGVSRVVGMVEGLGNAFVEYGEFDLKRLLVKYAQIFLYKTLARNLDLLLFLNEDDRADIVDRYKVTVRDVKVLGGIGVDLERFKPHDADRAPSDFTFIFVARLLREKGVFEFLEAAEIVKADYPKARFIVLGGIDEGNPFALTGSELEGYIARGIVEYPGFVNDVDRWVGCADVFVLPSFYREGVPRSTQEAMALGKAIITTDVPGCRDTVIHGFNGILVQPRNVDSLVRAMRYFVDEPSKAREMGLNSRQLAEERFNVEEVNGRLISFLGLT